ncbi:MAG TPA: type IV secretion system protein [Candidatus Binataceae bacterium]|nr:type IV secretion system protein [Candidatus Binataceae bacterium]
MTTDFSFFQDVLNQFATIVAQWQTQIFALGTPLFWSMAFIELGLIGAIAVLSHDITAIVEDLVRGVMAIAVAYWLFQNAADFTRHGVVATLGLWGAMAGGVPANSMDPQSIMVAGFGLATTLLNALGSAHWLITPVNDVVVLGCAIVIVICFGWTAITLLELLIESYIACIGGTMLIPLGVTRFGHHYIERYLGWVVSVGIRLWFTYAILGIGVQLVAAWSASIQHNSSLITGNLVFPIEAACEAGIYVMMLTRIPNYVGTLVAGAVTTTFAHAMIAPTIQSAGQSAGAAAQGAADLAAVTAELTRKVDTMIFS